MKKFPEDQLIGQALGEDRVHRDITTKYLIPEDALSEAFIIVREEGVVCGLNIVKKIFKKLDPKVKFRVNRSDGDKVKKNDKILFIKGKARALLSGERVSLNFLSLLSGIATLTHAFVKKVSPHKVKIMDTRKTPPGLRALAREAVRCGGGVNHRFDLSAMVFIKDNHRVTPHNGLSLKEAVVHVRRKTSKPIEVEVDNMAQLKQAFGAHPDIILLDNMTVKQIKKAVVLNRKNKHRSLLEASGGVNLKNVRSIARTGVDRISIGALTHSPKAIDFSMEMAARKKG